MPSLFFLPMWPLGSNSGRLSGFLFTEASEMWGQEGAPGQPPAPKSKWPLEVAEDAGWWARYAGPCSCRVQVRRPHWLGCPLSGGQAIPPGSFLPSPGTRCSTPPPPERAPCAHHSPHHRGAPPWLEFGVCDGTVDKEHSPRGEAARAQLFLSVCGPPGSWSVYTKLQASRENLQPYHGILATLGLGRWGGMCVSLAPFPKETSGFM